LTERSLHSAFPLLGIGLVSSASIWLELALTQVFAVLFFYNYVFVILTVAVMGISLGAALVHQWGQRPGQDWARPAVAVTAAAWLALLLAVITVQTVAIDSRVLLTCLALLPQVCIGVTYASLFAAQPDASPRLYGADLVGAGLGALLAIALFNLAGPIAALPLAAAGWAVAGLIFWGGSQPRPGRRLPAVAVLALAAAAGLALQPPALDMGRLATPKPLTRLLQTVPGVSIVHTDWDAFGRVDVVAIPSAADQRQVFLNGAAGSVMPSASVDERAEERLRGEIGYFPFRDQPERVFVIGPGGGRDVLYALLAGSKEILGAEISPGVVRAVHRFAETNGDLFSRPGVAISVEDGRRALQRQEGRFDLIYLSEVVSLSAEYSSFVLAENTIYTVEAFRDYFKHLAPGGRVALKLYDELTLTRAFVTVVAALGHRGVSEADAARHIAVLLDPRLVSATEPLRSPLLLAYREALTPEGAAVLMRDAVDAGLTPLFVPHVYEHPPLAQLASGQTTLAAMIAGFSRADISPTTDSRPFFFEFRRGLPETLRQLLAILVAAVVASGLFLLYRRPCFGSSYWRFVLYFSLLGAGFLAAELAAIQRLTLLLGQPVTALAVGLGTVLLAAGCGSLTAARLSRIPARQLAAVAALAGAVLLGALGGLMASVAAGLDTAGLPVRILAGTAAIAPIFFLLGMPFPLGLHAAAQRLGPAMTPLAWAVNGLASAIGTAGTVAMALLWGFDVVLLAVAGVYALAALLAWRTL